MYKKNAGFTLIELIIVIAIIGVLATSLLALIDPLEQIRKGQDAGRKSTVTQLGKAVTAYAISRNAFLVPSTTWITTGLVPAGELKSEPDASITTVCTAAADANKEKDYCYKTGGTPTEAIVYTQVESKAEKSLCTTSGDVAFYVWSSKNNGKSGIVCTATEPTPGTQTFQ